MVKKSCARDGRRSSVAEADRSLEQWLSIVITITYEYCATDTDTIRAIVHGWLSIDSSTVIY